MFFTCTPALKISAELVQTISRQDGRSSHIMSQVLFRRTWFFFTVLLKSCSGTLLAALCRMINVSSGMLNFSFKFVMVSSSLSTFSSNFLFFFSDECNFCWNSLAFNVDCCNLSKSCSLLRFSLWYVWSCLATCNELFTQPILNIEGTAPFLSIFVSITIFVKMFTAYKNWVFCLPDNLSYPLFSNVMKNFWNRNIGVYTIFNTTISHCWKVLKLTVHTIPYK